MNHADIKIKVKINITQNKTSKDNGLNVIVKSDRKLLFTREAEYGTESSVSVSHPSPRVSAAAGCGVVSSCQGWKSQQSDGFCQDSEDSMNHSGHQ